MDKKFVFTIAQEPVAALGDHWVVRLNGKRTFVSKIKHRAIDEANDMATMLRHKGYSVECPGHDEDHDCG